MNQVLRSKSLKINSSMNNFGCGEDCGRRLLVEVEAENVDTTMLNPYVIIEVC